MSLSYKEFFTSNNIKKLAIFLHGYGSNGENLIALAPELSTIGIDIKFISPNAPFPHEFGALNGYQWFSLQDMVLEKLFLAVTKANDILEEFINEQLKKHNLTKKDLILIGFSQGSMMSLYNSLSSKDEISAVISYSGKLIPPTIFGQKINSKPKICLIHGKNDDVVPFSYFLDAKKTLTEMGFNFEAHALDGLDHSIDYRGVRIAQNFIKNL